MSEITLRVPCPWCKKSETHIERPADASITVQCPNCNRFYRIYAANGNTEKTAAHRRLRTIASSSTKNIIMNTPND